MTYKEWCKETTGYEPQTTFWEDFSIAEMYGKNAIEDTYNKAFNEWKSNYKYITELVLVLNHKLWNHYDHYHMALANVYNDLWEKCDAWCCEHLKGKELDYFYKITD